jgi:hypothetical protein
LLTKASGRRVHSIEATSAPASGIRGGGYDDNDDDRSSVSSGSGGVATEAGVSTAVRAGPRAHARECPKKKEKALLVGVDEERPR